MNELSRTVVSDFVVAFPAAPARRGASAAPVATRLTVRKSRRVVMEALRVCGRGDALGGGDGRQGARACQGSASPQNLDWKSPRLNSRPRPTSHAGFCLT